MGLLPVESLTATGGVYGLPQNPANPYLIVPKVFILPSQAQKVNVLSEPLPDKEIVFPVAQSV